MLITFEGLPGAGKTTQTALLADCLRRNGHTVTALPDLATLDAEPIAATLIELLTATGDPYLRSGDAITDTLLTAAIRADLVATILDPALTTTPAAVVIEDRGIHTMASYAIASLLRDHRTPVDIALGWLHALTTLTGPRPTHALWLRIPPMLAARRAAARVAASPTTAHRPEHQAYLNRVHHAYELLAEHDPQLTALDVADLNPQHTHQAIHHALSRHSPTAKLGLTDCPSRHNLTDNCP